MLCYIRKARCCDPLCYSLPGGGECIRRALFQNAINAISKKLGSNVNPKFVDSVLEKRSSYVNTVSELDIEIENLVFGMAITAFWKRSVYIYTHT